MFDCITSQKSWTQQTLNQEEQRIWTEQAFSALIITNQTQTQTNKQLKKLGLGLEILTSRDEQNPPAYAIIHKVPFSSQSAPGHHVG